MLNKASVDPDGTPNPFIQKHQADVIGVLRGFDRLRLAGTFRALYHPPVMEMYIKRAGFLMKDFKALMLQVTGQIKAATQQLAEKSGRPLIYLSSGQVRKEQVARMVAEKDGVSSGLIGILSCVEPCRTYTVGGNPKTKMLEAQLGWGKCLHYYFYHLHPVFGFMHLRLQTWFPFLINVCLNGRNWLAQQMTALGMRFQQMDNCFTWIEDAAKAQQLLDQQLNTRWTAELEKLVLENHPTYQAICRPMALSYYWTACESEYATDVLFARPQRLAQLYPRLVHHGIKSFGSRDVLRFFGPQAAEQRGGQIRRRVAQQPAKAGGRAAPQTLCQRQLDQDLRQARRGAASGNNHQPPRRVQSLAGQGERPGRKKRLARAAAGGGGSAAPGPSQPRRQRTLPQRPGCGG
jgi:hypothetical protein